MQKAPTSGFNVAPSELGSDFRGENPRVEEAGLGAFAAALAAESSTPNHLSGSETKFSPQSRTEGIKGQFGTLAGIPTQAGEQVGVHGIDLSKSRTIFENETAKFDRAKQAEPEKKKPETNLWNELLNPADLNTAPSRSPLSEYEAQLPQKIEAKRAELQRLTAKTKSNVAGRSALLIDSETQRTHVAEGGIAFFTYLAKIVKSESAFSMAQMRAKQQGRVRPTRKGPVNPFEGGRERKGDAVAEMMSKTEPLENNVGNND